MAGTLTCIRLRCLDWRTKSEFFFRFLIFGFKIETATLQSRCSESKWTFLKATLLQLLGKMYLLKMFNYDLSNIYRVLNWPTKSLKDLDLHVIEISLSWSNEIVNHHPRLKIRSHLKSWEYYLTDFSFFKIFESNQCQTESLESCGPSLIYWPQLPGRSRISQ